LSPQGGRRGALQIFCALTAEGLRLGRADVVQGFHTNATTLAAAALALVWRAPLVIKATHRYNFEQSTGARKRLQLRLMAGKVATWVVPSQSLLSVARSAGIPEAKLRYIPNGVDVDFFRPPDAAARSLARSELGYGTEEFVFLWIGRLDPFKDLNALLVTWGNAIAREPRARLLLVGDGEDEAVARQLLERYPDTVQRLHFRRDVRPLYHCADSLLLTTRGEGLSNTLLEAMASGLPAVASAVPENLEVAAALDFLVPFKREREGDLTAALVTMVHSRDRWHALSAQARSRAEAEYSLRATVAKWSSLYRSLLGMK
jgi:glycosyltransferase involved in cell wall biosynthesis